MAYLQVTFNNPVRYAKAKELFIAPEGLYTGQVAKRFVWPLLKVFWCYSRNLLTRMWLQFVYAGRKAALTIGNIKPIGEMPEGAIVSNVEAVSSSFLYLHHLCDITASIDPPLALADFIGRTHWPLAS